MAGQGRRTLVFAPHCYDAGAADDTYETEDDRVLPVTHFTAAQQEEILASHMNGMRQAFTNMQQWASSPLPSWVLVNTMRIDGNTVAVALAADAPADDALILAEINRQGEGALEAVAEMSLPGYPLLILGEDAEIVTGA